MLKPVRIAENGISQGYLSVILRGLIGCDIELPWELHVSGFWDLYRNLGRRVRDAFLEE